MVKPRPARPSRTLSASAQFFSLRAAARASRSACTASALPIPSKPAILAASSTTSAGYDAERSCSPAATSMPKQPISSTTASRAAATAGTSAAAMALPATAALSSPTRVKTLPSASGALKSSSMAATKAARAVSTAAWRAAASTAGSPSAALASSQSAFFTAVSMRVSAASDSARRASPKTSGLR